MTNRFILHSILVLHTHITSTVPVSFIAGLTSTWWAVMSFSIPKLNHSLRGLQSGNRRNSLCYFHFIIFIKNLLAKCWLCLH